MPEWSEASLAFLISMALEFGKKMLVALLLFWIGRKLIRYVMKFCNRIFERSRLDLGVITFLRNLINISLQVILIVIIADYLGLQTSSLVAVIGSAGLTLGLALQGSLANLAGAGTEVTGDYPGWTYRKESPLRDKMVEVYREMYHKEPVVEAIHAGVECGLLAHKIPGLDCVSIGPDMKDIHTAKEKLSIPSVERMWEYLLKVLEAL